MEHMKIWSVMMLISLVLSMVGCKSKTPSVPKYQEKYREANLIGEWISQETKFLPKDQNNEEKKNLIEDTLVFGYNNDVTLRKKTTYNYTSYHPEEVWGDYEVVTGSYRMKNDTLVMTLDYPNVKRTSFGNDPLSIFPTVHLKQTDSISYYYAVKEITTNTFTLVHFLRKWNGGSSNVQDMTVNYKRK